MRSAIVFVLLLALSGLFVVTQVTRKRVPHRVPADRAASAPGTGSAAPVSPPRKNQVKPGAKTRPGSQARTPAARQALPPRLSRPLRVAGLGWELIAAGVVANGGAAPSPSSRFGKERLRVHLTAFPTMEEVEAALARGGADASGADVAIVPLPELVASYEKLRALAPQIFLVLGWSNGRDAFFARRPEALQKLPRAGKVALAAVPGSATFLGLFLLGAAGVEASRVSLLDPAEPVRTGPPGKVAPPAVALAALSRPLPSTLKLDPELRPLLTTADLRRLIPLVAVAPAGLIKEHSEALAAWGQVWMAGIDQLQRDVPAAARQVAALPAAPAALELLGRLGQMEPASLNDNARVFGLSGRDPVTLDELFRRCWTLWRGAGLLTSPLPERAPIHPEVLATMVRTYPTLVEALPPPRPAPPRTLEPAAEEARPVLLIHSPRLRRIDPRQDLAAIGFLAGIFERSTLTVSVRGNLGQARALVEGTIQRYELPAPRRLRPAARKAGPLLSIEVSLPR